MCTRKSSHPWFLVVQRYVTKFLLGLSKGWHTLSSWNGLFPPLPPCWGTVPSVYWGHLFFLPCWLQCGHCCLGDGDEIQVLTTLFPWLPRGSAPPCAVMQGGHIRTGGAASLPCRSVNKTSFSGPFFCTVAQWPARAVRKMEGKS